VVESDGIPITIVESVDICFLDTMDSYCLLVMFESAVMRVLIVNLGLFTSMAKAAGISIALVESGVCFLDAFNCCCLLLTTYVFIYG
jgi:hypothetical protein